MNATSSIALTLNQHDMERLAIIVAELVEPGDCLLLRGDLGVGKTTFATNFITHLCHDAIVTSPTFTIAQPYKAGNGKEIWHYDLYRLEDGDEVMETGLTETMEYAINLIEWPDIAKTYLHDGCVNITFAFDDKPDYRTVEITGEPQWMQQLQQQLTQQALALS